MGCGKTTSGADYAREAALTGVGSRLLILTHTHAACSVFAERTRGVGSGVEIRTIDSIIAHIASAYHIGLGLPADALPLPKGYAVRCADDYKSVTVLLISKRKYRRWPNWDKIAPLLPPYAQIVEDEDPNTHVWRKTLYF